VEVDAVDLAASLPDEVAVAAAVAALEPSTAHSLLDAAVFRRSRRTMERAEIARLAAELPLPSVMLPARLAAGLSATDIDALAGELS